MDVVDLCQALLRFDTSNPGATEERAAAFVVDALAKSGIPSEVLEPAPGRCSVFASHDGQDDSLPALVVHGHLDVVPPQETGWTHDPFGGVVADGCLWGRGAVDMKGAVAMMLATQLALAASGRKPRRRVVFAYFADEEMGGAMGARHVVAHRPDLFEGVSDAVGEVGGFSITMPSGRRIYPLQCAERGALWCRFSLWGPGGHAAFGGVDNPVVGLADLIRRLGELTVETGPPPVYERFLETVGELGGVSDDGTLNGLGLFGQLVRAGGRTSFEPTVVRAGAKTNVIPDLAEVEVDCRFVPGGEEEALAAMRRVAADCGADLDLTMRMPGNASPTDGELPRACLEAVREVDPDGLVVPYIVPGGTDGGHLGQLGIRSYGFTPLVLPAGFDYPAMFHAPDERVPVDALRLGHEIFTRLVTGY
jgi:acetylornithine deacetylase/succinyl-diaminopimelate desuccinylase-like protein